MPILLNANNLGYWITDCLLKGRLSIPTVPVIHFKLNSTCVFNYTIFKKCKQETGFLKEKKYDIKLWMTASHSDLLTWQCFSIVHSFDSWLCYCNNKYILHTSFVVNNDTQECPNWNIKIIFIIYINRMKRYISKNGH